MSSDKAVFGLSCFLTGAALGASVALLMAPHSGRMTRRAIRRRAEEAGDYVSEIGDELAEKGRELYERGVSAARQAADEASQSVREKVEKAKGARA